MGNLGPNAFPLNLRTALHQGHVALLPVEAVLAGIPGLKALLIPNCRALHQLTLQYHFPPSSKRSVLVTHPVTGHKLGSHN